MGGVRGKAQKPIHQNDKAHKKFKPRNLASQNWLLVLSADHPRSFALVETGTCSKFGFLAVNKLCLPTFDFSDDFVQHLVAQSSVRVHLYNHVLRKLASKIRRSFEVFPRPVVVT